MATQAQRKRQETGKQAGFIVSVTGDLGPFKAGQELTLERQIIEYGKAIAVNEELDVSGLDDVQILAALKIDVTGLDADGRYGAWAESLGNMDEPLEDTSDPQKPTGPIATNAMQLGNLVSNDTQLIVERGLDGKKLYDATPIVFRAGLVHDIGKMVNDDGTPLLDTIPWIGAKKQGKHNKKGESMDNVPAGYNMPTQYFTYTDDMGKKHTPNWTKLFVEQWPRMKPIFDEISQLNGWLGKEHVIPRDPKPALKAFIEAQDVDGAGAYKKNLEQDVTNTMSRVNRALSFHQVLRRIELEFPQIAVCYTSFPDRDMGEIEGDALVTAAKSSRPLRLGRVTKTKDGKERVTWGNAVTMTQFIGFGKPMTKPGFVPSLLDMAKGETNPLAKLNELYKLSRQRANGDNRTSSTTSNALPASAINAPKIGSAPVLADTLCQVGEYLASRDLGSTLMAAIRESKDGARIAYWIARIQGELADLASEDLVKVKAKAWDDDQNAAMVDAEKARQAQVKADAEKKAA